MKKKFWSIASIIVLIIFLFSLVSCDFNELEHMHIYSLIYSYDEDGHWYETTCGHDLKKDYNKHTYELVSSTYEQDGKVLIKCTVCGYSCEDTGDYDINYKLKGGTNSENNPDDYTVVSDTITLEEPTRVGYTFTGWTTDTKTTPEKNVIIEKGSVGDKTFFANWEANTYTVTLDTTGYTFTGKTSYTVTYGKSYTFDIIDGIDGWVLNNNTLVTDEKGYGASWNIANDVVLTPKLTTKYFYKNSTKTNLYFGSYPQTQEIDENIISNLNTIAGELPTSDNTYNWTDYGYYMEESVSSYMYYIDIDENNDGTNDYRGVYFTSYRPSATSYTSTYYNTYQDDNGYNINTVYWFKYEPIKWDILKTDDNKALIISNLILDSQDYNHTISSQIGAIDYQGNITTDIIDADNYRYAHIRSWLNQTFYDAAFNTLEKQIIEVTKVDNSGKAFYYCGDLSSCGDTNDNIFILSNEEWYKCFSVYGKNITTYSDYAKSQGLCVSKTSIYFHYFWLRSPSIGDDAYSCVNSSGCSMFNCDITSFGVRPACWINL